MLNGKKLALLVAFFALLTGITVFAESPGFAVGDAAGDNAVEVYMSSDSNYYTYFNKTYGYSLEVPKTATQMESTTYGDGAYFQDPADTVTIFVYGAVNRLNFTVDELYTMDMGINGSPALTTNTRTGDSFTVSWNKDGKSYYHVFSYNKKSNTYAAFSVIYQTSQEAQYRPVLQHMTETFVPAGAVEPKSL
ncbi:MULTISPECIES: hypothetical protein [Megasphaera]|uniref:Uncharacterized protein n=1 Tax=Megasphaera vaginalis (ex Srinivasan et al. 2021) TaxID=1111454 RepID=U7UTE6_9FIRM|nr:MULTISPECIES: hypothetical protein [Megasphaera]ERT61723.1 hypothetical protein HMPREF1250_2112 [Megasphaera vaginalis (ex Srinivasan et al. 2021)]